MKKRILILFVIGLLLIVGCGKKKNTQNNTKPNMTNFYFSYVFYDESCTFSITTEKNVVEFSAIGNKSYCNSQVDNVDKEYIEKLEKIIEENELTKWKSFNEQVEDIDSDNEFSLQIGYDNGENIFAYGYNKYPDNYDVVRKEFIKLFESIK